LTIAVLAVLVARLPAYAIHSQVRGNPDLWPLLYVWPLLWIAVLLYYTVSPRFQQWRTPVISAPKGAAAA
jgi:hypothetical protein